MTGDWSAAHFESKSIPDCSQKLPNAIPKQFGRRPVVKVYFQSACGVLGEAKMARFVWAHVHNQSLPRSALTSTNLGKTVFFLFQASSLHIFGLALVARHFIFELQLAIQDVRFQSSSSFFACIHHASQSKQGFLPSSRFRLRSYIFLSGRLLSIVLHNLLRQGGLRHARAHAASWFSVSSWFG